MFIVYTALFVDMKTTTETRLQVFSKIPLSLSTPESSPSYIHSLHAKRHHNIEILPESHPQKHVYTTECSQSSLKVIHAYMVVRKFLGLFYAL